MGSVFFTISADKLEKKEHDAYGKLEKKEHDAYGKLEKKEHDTCGKLEKKNTTLEYKSTDYRYTQRKLYSKHQPKWSPKRKAAENAQARTGVQSESYRLARSPYNFCSKSYRAIVTR